jgi:hypothetical protein
MTPPDALPSVPRVTRFQKLRDGIKAHRSLTWRQAWNDDNKWQHIMAVLFVNLPTGLYIGMPLFRGYISDSKIPVVHALSNVAPQSFWGCALTFMAGIITLTYLRGNLQHMFWAARVNEAIWFGIALILVLTGTPGVGTILSIPIFLHEHRRCEQIEKEYRRQCKIVEVENRGGQ